MHTKALQVVAAVACVTSISALDAVGQTRWLPPRNYNSAVLEVMKPKLESDDVSFLTLASIATAQFALDREKRHFIVVDVPFARLGIDGVDSETAIGNPYIGVTIFDGSNPVIYEFGGRIPISSNNSAAITGTLADFDRFEAYAPETASVSAALNYFPSRSGDWVLQTRIGPTVLFDLDPGEFDATADLFASYSVQTWYYSGAFSAWARNLGPPTGYRRRKLGRSNRPSGRGQYAIRLQVRNAWRSHSFAPRQRPIRLHRSSLRYKRDGPFMTMARRGHPPK